ncbi:trypsin-like peptidase domain-containing protein [Massilia oculi]|uniref:trypsin-like peptidase domain-containing protein n=1 Tax=Massilia oculi TaxID=945844 RepID=UPI001AAE386D|nr:trypsin-like peptidase domain-containing protein [Massilia oculi]
MLSEFEVAAIQKFTLGVTMPILVEAPDGSVCLLATGTLFRIGEQHLIITARHVFDDVMPEWLAYPAAPMGGDTHTLGEYTVFKPKEKHVDVAVLRLESAETIDRLTKSWQFLSLENVARPVDNAPDKAFFVAGYPGAMTQMVGAKLHGNFVAVYSQLIPETPLEAKKPVVPDLDMFFDYGKKAQKVGGGEIDSPELPGVSGASVWQIGQVDGIWTPEAAVRVVGVQSSYKHSEFFRAKSWLAVAQVLDQIDEGLALSIRTHLNSGK